MKRRMARGNPQAPIHKPVRGEDADAISARRKSLEEEVDLDWLQEGALSFANCNMQINRYPAEKVTEKVLVESYAGDPEPAVRNGQPLFYHGAYYVNMNTRRGPARVLRHVWCDGLGGKYLVPLKFLTKDGTVPENM